MDRGGPFVGCVAVCAAVCFDGFWDRRESGVIEGLLALGRAWAFAGFGLLPFRFTRGTEETEVDQFVEFAFGFEVGVADRRTGPRRVPTID